MGSANKNPKNRVNIDKQLLAAPMKSSVDKYQLLPEYLKVSGLVRQHLDSYNYFIRTGIRKIVSTNCLIQSEDDPKLYLRYKNVYVGEPSMLIDGVNTALTPHMCRLSDITYAAPIYVDIEYTFYNKNKEMTHTRKVHDKVVIGRMPIMLRSHSCVLYKKSDEELAKLGECPLDPGGYFIIKGSERVILMQEQLSKNRIIIDKDKNGHVQASVMSSTAEFKTKTIIKMEKERIYLYLNQLKKVPIMVVMKAMGMESDQEIVQMLGRDPRYSALLLPSIEECANKRVFTQYQALEVLEKEVTSSSYYKSSGQKEGRALHTLRNVLLVNVPVHNNNFRAKCIYVAVMIRRMMEAIINKDTMDDKDYMGNKRIEVSGQLLSLLFEDLFKTLNETTKKNIDQQLSRKTKSDVNILRDICTTTITHGLERSLSTGNFHINRFKMNRKGATMLVGRLSYIHTLGFMTKVEPQFEKTNKVSGPRALQPSQWGMLCPCDTPEGASIGLSKNIALMTHVTTDQDERPIISLCQTFGVVDLENISGEELHTKDSFLVMLNGGIIGKHWKPYDFVNTMRKLRRAGRISGFVSIFVHDKQRCIHIASDGGRVCRPLVIADKGVSRITELHMKELRDGVRNFDSFLHDGLLEYLDVNEQNNALIALYEKDTTPETTHIEIEPFTILSLGAGLIPYPHHNQSPRNTYQCCMGKQAMGHLAHNQLNRLDSLLSLLVYPQRPLLTTRTIELIGYDKLGGGQNATVAVMSFSGYDIEDAIVMNKSSLDRGFGRCIVMKKLKVIIKKNEVHSERITRPVRKGKDAELMQIMDDDGMASPGEIIRQGDIYLNKECLKDSKNKNSSFISRKLTYKPIETELTVVDKVAIFSDKDNNMCVNFVTRRTRRPEVGDKFSSRHGQKGVCGTIIQQEDFPFTERGICPDLIMNPHGFPSRMTVGKMIELLGSKAGVSCGRFHYGSAFGEESGHADTVDSISKTLVGHGFSYNGKDFIYSGITGLPLQAYIFMGPIYYQKLKHMVMDKMHARATGPTNMLVRQPTEGRSKRGGLRMGEMERDCLVAYGTSMLLYERMMLSSDAFEVQICEKCGLLGYYNYKLKQGMCSTCKNGDNMSSMKLPYACKLLFQELQSMNIIPRLKLKD